MLPISIRHKNHGYFEKHLKEVDQEMKSESLQFLIPCFWSKVFQTSLNVNLIYILVQIADTALWKPNHALVQL